MSDDLIKRFDAIEAIEDTTWYHQNKNKDMVSGANSDEHQAWYKADDVYKALEAVPSADRPQEWIPCEERLPEEDKDVLAWVESGDEARIACCNYAKGVWFDAIMDVVVKPVAWMSLPEPYHIGEATKMVEPMP